MGHTSRGTTAIIEIAAATDCWGLIYLRPLAHDAQLDTISVAQESLRVFMRLNALVKVHGILFDYFQQFRAPFSQHAILAVSVRNHHIARESSLL